MTLTTSSFHPNQANDLQAIYLQRPKTHENMPPRTKTVSQQELRRLRVELRKTKKLVHSERQRSNSAVEHLLQLKSSLHAALMQQA